MSRAVQILQRREVFNRFVFRIDEVRLQHERFDGSMSEPITRLVLNRGDSVAVLLHDTANQSVLLCEQFRLPALEHAGGWLLELPAGIVDPGETEEDAARRETLEEIGYSTPTVSRIATVYLSPGGSSERVHIFHAEVAATNRTGPGGGVIKEGEDIKLISMPVAEAISLAHAGKILDAKTLIALQWLEIKNV